MAFSNRLNKRRLSGSRYFCVSCGKQLQEGRKVFVFEWTWQRVVEQNGRLVLVQCLENGVEQFLLCKDCELKA